MERRAETLAKIGDLAMRSTAFAASLHAFFAVGFGSSLIATGLLGRQSASPSYQYLEQIPGWPYVMGAVFVASGVILTGANVFRVSRERYCYAAIGFSTQAVASAVYAALFIAGTFASEAAILGPQWLYGLVAALATGKAWYSVKAMRVAEQMGE